jgi:protein-S-isoprenylcysteine O-methyltransferase Ste14
LENKIIIAIVMGMLAYAVAFLFDVVSMKKIAGAKTLIVVVVLGLHAYALYVSLWAVDRFSLPTGLSLFGWITLPIFVLLLLYSLTIGLPAGRTYFRPGVPQRIVKTGLYALSRHPGIIWYTLAAVSLILASRSVVVLIAAPVWVALDIIYAIVQEKFFFIKMFPEYRQYQQETPMLVPSAKSIIACIRTLRGRTNINTKGAVL